MIGYVDSSVVLRDLLQQPRSMPLPALATAYSSALLRVECLRTVDRMRLQGSIGDEQRATLVERIEEKCRMLRLVEVSAEILALAGQPLSVVLATLDAIHLATALAVGVEVGEAPVMITHDRQLALAARGLGLAALGDD